MKKILVIQPIHEAGIELLKNNSNYEFEVVKMLILNFLNQKLKIVMQHRLEQQN